MGKARHGEGTESGSKENASVNMDDVLVKLSDGSFVRKPMSEVLVAAGVVSVDPVLSSTPKTVFQAPSLFRDSGIMAVANRIVGRCQIGADDVGSRRLRTFVLQYLEGRAKPHELQGFLVRSEKIGGLGLSEEVAKTCSAVIDSELESGSFRIGDHPRPSPLPPAPAVPAMPVKTPPLTLVAPATAPAKPVIPALVPSALKPAPALVAPPLPIVKSESSRLPLRPDAAAVPVTLAAPTSNSARPSVVDVRPPRSQTPPVPSIEDSSVASFKASESKSSWWGSGNRTVAAGPADEFHFTLDDFRRLAKDPDERLTMLQEKMERLGKEGYAFQQAAVEQWKHSEVFLLYLAVARESIARGRSVVDTLAAAARDGSPCLSMEEVTIVGQFNRWLGI